MYVVNGNELEKRDDDLERYEACRRKHPSPTPGPDGKISAEAFLTDPCEPLDLESYTFQIVLNNQYGLIAVSPEAGKRDGAFTWVAGRMIIIDKLTGKYVETLLSTPRLPLGPQAKTQSDAGISVNGYGGTCDMVPPGNPNSISGVPDGSHDPAPDPVVVEKKKPQKKSDAHEAHVHVRHHPHDHRR